MLHRERFEKEYESVFGKFKYGSTVWSPLASGILTGRYNTGELAEGRYSTPSNISGFKDQVWEAFFSAEKREKNIKALHELADLAKELGFTQTQLAIAWALASRDVSTLILGFSKVAYVDENLKALELYKKWTPEIE